MIRGLTLVVLALSLAACATLRRIDADREYREAVRDHARCTAEGRTFPADDYVNCRRHAADARQRDQWLELSMHQQLDRSRTPEQVQPLAPPAPYRPISAERWACEERTRDGATWIACRER